MLPFLYIDTTKAGFHMSGEVPWFSKAWKIRERAGAISLAKVWFNFILNYKLVSAQKLWNMSSIPVCLIVWTILKSYEMNNIVFVSKGVVRPNCTLFCTTFKPKGINVMRCSWIFARHLTKSLTPVFLVNYNFMVLKALSWGA